MRWMVRAALVTALATGALAMACGDDDDNGDDAGNGTPGSSVQTPGPVTTREGQDPTEIDTGATPDAVDPNVVSAVGLDANPGTPEIDSAGAVSADFVVAYTVTELGLPMVGYQFDVDWEGTNVEFVSLEHLENGGLTLCPQTVQLSPQRILGACAQPQLVSTDYTGQLSLLTFRCTAPGETTLHLRYQEGSFGTKIETVTPEIETSHTLELSDATVTCA